MSTLNPKAMPFVPSKTIPSKIILSPSNPSNPSNPSKITTPSKPFKLYKITTPSKPFKLYKITTPSNPSNPSKITTPSNTDYLDQLHALSTAVAEYVLAPITHKQLEDIIKARRG